jgi:cob(I)alamin adenosyltransferase
MSFPQKIRILGRDYIVEYNEELNGLYGKCDERNQLISIAPNQLPSLEVDTVLHEIVHGISDVMNLGMKERQVYCITTGLIAVMKDNPDFLEYLNRMLNK